MESVLRDEEVTTDKENKCPNSLSSQDVYMDSSASIPFSFSLQSSGVSSPQRRRNMKDFEVQMQQLKKENFDLRLRIYFLEERVSRKNLKGDKDLHKANMELKVETESLKKELADKQELVRQASTLVTSLEEKFKERLGSVEALHQKQKTFLEDKINTLEKELGHLRDSSVKDDGVADLTQLCELAFGSSKSSKQPAELLEGKQTNGDESNNFLDCEKQSKAACESADRIHELEAEVERLSHKVQELEEDIQEKERTTNALNEDIINLKKEIEDREDRMVDLEQEVVEKDQRIDHLMQDLETRHLEIVSQESKIQTLNEDLKKVEPEIEVKIQEINEKSRIIEAKTDQIQQQNKILVEIQITLDEKQKQIAELEDQLAQSKRETESFSKQLDYSVMSIKTMTDRALIQTKENNQLKKDLKKEERKVKDLFGKLREALDTINKAKWEAEVGAGGEDTVKEMVEEESERLWTELEQRRYQILNLQSKNESLLQEAKDTEARLIKEKEESCAKIKIIEAELEHLKCGQNENPDYLKLLNELNSRDSALKNQEILIENLRTELLSTKQDLNERKHELTDVKNDLKDKHKCFLEFLTKEMKDNKSEMKYLFDKLCSKTGNDQNPVDMLKTLFDKSLNHDTTDSHALKKSNSLSRLDVEEISAKDQGSSSHPNVKSGRSNSFSLLENSLYAHMGQKMYNTTQNFNTYIFPNEELQRKDSVDVNLLPIENPLAEHSPKRVKSVQTISSDSNHVLPNTVPSHNSNDGELKQQSSLHQDIIDFRGEVQSLKNDREALRSDLQSLRNLIQTLTNPEAITVNKETNEVGNESHDDTYLNFIQPHILLISKYQEAMKYYKEKSISLQKHLTDSHHSCDLLRRRLEELSEFLEVILDMDRRGIINLSHLGSPQRGSLQKSLNDSRALSHSLSQSVLIGMDSTSASFLVEDFNVTNKFENTFDFEHDLKANQNEYFSSLNHVFSKFAGKIEAIDDFASKLLELSSLLISKEGNSKTAALRPYRSEENRLYERLNSDQLSLQLNEEQVTNHTQPSNTIPVSSPLSNSVRLSNVFLWNSIEDKLELNLIDIAPPFVTTSSETGLVRTLEGHLQRISSPPNARTHSNEGKTCHQTPVHSNIVLVSPSESEGWSEPDRNVSLARIGLEAGNTVLVPQPDRPLSRDRVSRSAPFTSESDCDNSQEDALDCSLPSFSKLKRSRPENLEIKRLNSKIKSLQDLNNSLKSELDIHQTFKSVLKPTDSISSGGRILVDPVVAPSEFTHNESNIGSLLLQEINTLRLRLEESITYNDKLQNQLVAALSGHVCEDCLAISQKLQDVQVDLKQTEEKLSLAVDAEQLLQAEIKNNESKTYEMSTRLASYMTANQELEKKFDLMNKKLKEKEQRLHQTEKELNDTVTLKSLSEKINEDDQVLISDLRIEIHNLNEKLVKHGEIIKEKKSEIDSLKFRIEQINSDLEMKLTEKENKIRSLYEVVQNSGEKTSNNSDRIIETLRKSLQETEGRLLQATKEKFSLAGDNALLHSQMASITMKNDILQKDLQELSPTKLNSDDSNKQYFECFHEVSNLQKEKQELNDEIEVLHEKYESLFANSRLLETENAKLKMELKQYDECKTSILKLRTDLKECEVIKQRLESQLRSEGRSNQSLRSEIKLLQSNYQPNKVVRHSGTQMNNTVHQRSTDAISKPQSNVPLDLWTANKENRMPTSMSPNSGFSGSLSGESPDLGIEGSDDLYSSLEISSSRRRRNEVALQDPRGQGDKLALLCNEPDHSNLISELAKLRLDHDSLSSKLSTAEVDLQSALKRLSEVTRQKESVERAVRKELTKTHQVLKKAKGNLLHCKKSKEDKFGPREPSNS